MDYWFIAKISSACGTKKRDNMNDTITKETEIIEVAEAPTEQQHWDYEIFEIHHERLRTTCIKMGADNWELVNFHFIPNTKMKGQDGIYDGKALLAVFKRPYTGIREKYRDKYVM